MYIIIFLEVCIRQLLCHAYMDYIYLMTLSYITFQARCTCVSTVLC